MAEFPTYKEMGKKVAEEALDGYIYKGKTIREWIDIVAQAQWIPVSERLPNFNDIVLASADSDYDELRVILTVYSGEEFWFNGKIKAWMPLPEPYKAESEEI